MGIPIPSARGSVYAPAVFLREVHNDIRAAFIARDINLLDADLIFGDDEGVVPDGRLRQD